MFEFTEKDDTSIDSHTSSISLSIVLIVLGFASIALYMGSTIFYPLLDYDGFVGLSMREGINQALIGRYVGYLPLLIFGALPVIVGNWLLYAKKQVDATVVVTIFMALFVSFLIMILQMIYGEAI